MSSWKSQMRAAAAFQRQIEREAIRQRRELERQTKERSKLDAIEQARLEVKMFENQIEVLLSVHKDCAAPWDWFAAATTLPPPRATKITYNELRAMQEMKILRAFEQNEWKTKLEAARLQDEEVFQSALAKYADDYREWEKQVALASRVRTGEASAYAEAINELSTLAEIQHLGSSTEFTVHSPRLLQCDLVLNSSAAIPSEMKTLTVSNKVSTKPMPTARFHEIYQDYLCSCMLRVARELFALLPIETLLLTARTVITDPRTGHAGEQPVLSVSLPRAGVFALNFERLDPSDTIESFLHRGDFKASRKTGAFAPISPLTVGDIVPMSEATLGISDLLKRAEELRREIRNALSAFKPSTEVSPAS